MNPCTPIPIVDQSSLPYRPSFRWCRSLAIVAFVCACLAGVFALRTIGVAITGRWQAHAVLCADVARWQAATRECIRSMSDEALRGSCWEEFSVRPIELDARAAKLQDAMLVKKINNHIAALTHEMDMLEKALRFDNEKRSYR